MNLLLKSFSMMALCSALSWAHAQTANAPAPASQGLAQGMGLDELTRAMLERNPQLRGARWSADAARMGVSPAGAPDNPTVSMLQDQVRNNPLAWNKSGSSSWTWSQNIYWPGKKSLNAQVASDQADAQQAQAMALQSQLLGQMRSTWLSWQSTQAQLALLQAQVDKMQQIKDITKIRYSQNAAAFADYINAQVMQEQLRTNIISTQLQADTLLGQLANLIGQENPKGLVLQVEDLSIPPSAPTLAEWEQRALEQHPMLKASAAAVQQARHSLELAELNKRPDFNMAVSGYANQPPWGLAHNSAYAFSVGMTFPFWYEQKEKYLINQAELQLKSSQENDASQRQQITLSVRSAWLQWKQNIEQYQLFETSILQQARLAYRLTLKNYSVGQNSYVDLLNAFNAERGAEANAIQARANVWMAQAALKAAAGDINPHNQP